MNENLLLNGNFGEGEFTPDYWWSWQDYGGATFTWVDQAHIRIDNTVLNNSVNEPQKEPEFIIPPWGKLEISDQPLWEIDCEGAVALARCKNAVLFAGNPDEGNASIEALDIQSGKRLWRWSPQLPSSPVPWGLAVDRDGRIMVTLEDGQVLCFGQGD